MTRVCFVSSLRRGLVLCLGLLFSASLQASDFNVPNRRFAVEVSAQVQDSPPQIHLSWIADPDATSYQVQRRTLDAGWTSIANLGGGATSYTDSNVSVGTRYEYQFIKQSSIGYIGYGYISCGIKIPLVDYRGKIILLVENSLTGPLSAELDQLAQDLTGDGWVVIRETCSRSDSPPSVKSKIKTIWDSDPQNVKALFMFGNIPVAYSGNIDPDGHLNHTGAWPADPYYGELTSEWTDNTVNITSSERRENWNTPGDGKFDQSEIPSDMELQVGRVDLSNMTCFANKNPSRSELDLMRQYLNKDHRFRHAGLDVPRRGIICDAFGDKGKDPIVCSAWRNWPGFFGSENVTEVGWDQWIPGTKDNAYLWSYGSGGGSYYYATGVASSDDFALNDPKVVFTMWMGSYFGDWNNESNFLRAPLGSSSYVLTSSYSGFPQWMYFPMALGDTIGYATIITQNNRTNGANLYPPLAQGAGNPHISLMGDPTLRMHPVRPPSNLNISSSPGAAVLSWNASTDSNLEGYHVYRATQPQGPYTRVTSNPVGGTSFTDTPGEGIFYYMVRAIKLETSSSGTYYNPSQGIFGSVNVTGSVASAPSAPTGLNAVATSSTAVRVTWNDLPNETGYKLERKTGANGTWDLIVGFGVNVTSYLDEGRTGSTTYTYRLRGFNDLGDGPYSNESSATTFAPPQPQATVGFVESDSSTQGNWPLKYGIEGYEVIGGSAQLPSYGQIVPVSKSDFIWDTSSTETRALLAAPSGSTRVAAAWYGDPVSLNLSISGDTARRVALYFLDWDRQGRSSRVEIVDAATGLTLDSRALSNFGDGIYLVWNIKGAVQIRVVKDSGENAVLMGLFFGGAISNPINNQPLSVSALKGANGITIMVSGASGQKFVLQGSTDFVNWIDLRTETLSGNSIQLTETLGGAARFYRTRNSP